MNTTIFYSFVSAHNTNIYHLTTALGYIHEVMIPFGSSLIYELHYDNEVKKFYIKVLYDGKEISIENTKFLARFEDKLKAYKQTHNFLETLDNSENKVNEGIYLNVILALLVFIMICSLILGVMAKEKDAQIENSPKKQKRN